MTSDELLGHFLSRIFTRWTWWQWHFEAVMRGEPVRFVDALFDALLEIDAVIPGYAARTADALLDIAGPEKHEPHYEQILQRLAEVYIVGQLVRANWPWPVSFEDEPTAAGSARNPELVVRGPGMFIGIEVKAPALLTHARTRAERPIQSGGRVLPAGRLEEIAGGASRVTLPRDNPVKDFLASANDKF